MKKAWYSDFLRVIAIDIMEGSFKVAINPRRRTEEGEGKIEEPGINLVSDTHAVGSDFVGFPKELNLSLKTFKGFLSEITLEFSPG